MMNWLLLTLGYTALFYIGYFAAFLTNPRAMFNEIAAYTVALQDVLDGMLVQRKGRA